MLRFVSRFLISIAVLTALAVLDLGSHANAGFVPTVSTADSNWHCESAAAVSSDMPTSRNLIFGHPFSAVAFQFLGSISDMSSPESSSSTSYSHVYGDLPGLHDLSKSIVVVYLGLVVVSFYDSALIDTLLDPPRLV